MRDRGKREPGSRCGRGMIRGSWFLEEALVFLENVVAFWDSQVRSSRPGMFVYFGGGWGRGCFQPTLARRASRVNLVHYFISDRRAVHLKRNLSFSPSICANLVLYSNMSCNGAVAVVDYE